MIKIEKTKVMDLEPAIRGIRNRTNSWSESDSIFYDDGEYHDIFGNSLPTILPDNCETTIGANDINLMLRLARAGSMCWKFRRIITVYADITAPLYWWEEFDTYVVDTVSSSCSIMQKIQAKKFTLEDFSCEHLFNEPYHRDLITSAMVDEDVTSRHKVWATPLDILKFTIEMLNGWRDNYLDTKNKEDWWQIIQLLPSSYNQKRTVTLNYEVLANIYQYGCSRKLDEWREFCKWIEDLPYSNVITLK